MHFTRVWIWSGTAVLFFSAFMVAHGCGFDDADRCWTGYTWEKSTKSCIKDVDMGVAEDAAESEDTSFADSDASDVSGLGKECESTPECTEEDVDYCAISQGETKGICTVSGCSVSDPATCPDGYTCCDCTAVSSTTPVLCATDARAQELAAYCDCDNE